MLNNTRLENAYCACPNVRGRSDGIAVRSRLGKGRVQRSSLLGCGLALAVLWGGPGAKAEDAQIKPGQLRVLHTTQETRDLSGREAARGYPVHLEATVLFCDPPHTALFVHDSTGGIYVSVEPGSMVALAPGTQIEVDGVSAQGNFAPVVTSPKVRVTGTGRLPAQAHRVSLVQLQTGVEDSQWVEVEGIIRSAFVRDGDVILELAMTDGSIRVTMLRQPGVAYQQLTDAHVVMRATAASLFNDNRQMVGARLVSPGIGSIHILEAAPKDPFAARLQPITDLSRFSRRLSAVHRVHLRGRITLLWPGSLVCIEDGTGGLCAQTAERPDLHLGVEADVIGFPAKGQSAPILTNAVVRGVAGSAPGKEHPLTGAGVLRLANDARLVDLEGEVMGVDPTASDTTLLVSSQDGIFAAVLPKDLTTVPASKSPQGSRIRLRGICAAEVDTFRSVQMGGVTVSKGYRLLLRSPADIVVLTKPTWWTPNHSLLLVAGVLAVTFLVLGWVAVLRRTVERQTKTIRESEERFKYMAQHDALTGLATRGLLHERLEAALAVCREDGTGLALLMVDLDHFKQINDSYGHDAGDETLRVTAARMTGALRECDTVARLGGDEFIVLLTGLDDLTAAEGVAAELVEVLSQPIHFGERSLAVSASVGVCSTLSEQFDARSLLKSVDAAMYRAKAQGRRRFQTVRAFEVAAV